MNLAEADTSHSSDAETEDTGKCTVLQSALRRTHLLNHVNAAITSCVRMCDRFVYDVDQPPDDW